MLNLIKMQFKSDSFKRFNIIVISLSAIFITIATVFKHNNFNMTNSIYPNSIVFLNILFFNLENNKTNIMLNSLPINKKDIVIKNYIYIFVAFLLVNFYTYISIYIITNINSLNMDFMGLNEIVVHLSILIIQLSLILPILHLISGVFSYFIVYIFLGLGGTIIMSYKATIESMIKSGNFYILPIVAFLIMVVSIYISIFFYSNREFEGVLEK